MRRRLLSEPRPVEAVLKRVHSLVEGPRVTARGDYIYSDVLGGGVFWHSASGDIDVVARRRRGIGGLVEHQKGGVVVTGRDLVHITPDGASRILLGRDGYTGFNDLTTTRSGQVLVGALRYRPMAGDEQVPGRLLRVGLQGRVEMLSDTVIWPNGIGLSPDGRHLYVSDFAREHVKRMTVQGKEETVFCDSPRGSADGLAVDVEGGVWIALGSGGGVARFAPDGRLDEIIDVPAAFVSSISFGGGDGRDVLISTGDNTLTPDTGGALFHARSEIPGVPVKRATI